jgi:DNA-binding SARP family transcriptional activator
MVAVSHNSSGHLTEGQLHPRVYEHEAVYRAYLFGPFRLYHRADRLDKEMLRRKKARQILIWFLLNPGKPGSMEQFIDLFWPDSPPTKAIGSFHVAMHSLRRTLEPHLLAGQESSFIRRRPNNFYSFEADDGWWTDTRDLEMLFERAYAYDFHGDRRRACFYYRRVASYGVQGFLPGQEYGDWLTAHQRRYQQIYAQALTRLMELHMGTDEPEELLEYAYQMVQFDHQNVIATQAIIDSDLRFGDVGRARRQLKSFLESLPQHLREGWREELGASLSHGFSC